MAEKVFRATTPEGENPPTVITANIRLNVGRCMGLAACGGSCKVDGREVTATCSAPDVGPGPDYKVYVLGGEVEPDERDAAMDSVASGFRVAPWSEE